MPAVSPPATTSMLAKPMAVSVFLASCSYDVLALFGKRKNFSAIDVDRRNATRDKDKRFILVDLDGFRPKQHLGNSLGNVAHGKLPFKS